jgi:hypothetical protein
MPPAFTSSNPEDISIANLTGLETYKALYKIWPNLYTYISDPLEPTNYFLTLVNGIIATSGFSLDVAGPLIRTTLLNIAKNITVPSEDYVLVQPLISSSYTIKYLNDTAIENTIWIAVTVFLAFFIIWYLYVVGLWSYIFNSMDGVACYDCGSVFDKFLL